MKYNSLLEVLESFPDEAACVKHLESLRWPSGIICPFCGESGKIHRYKTRLIYKCGDCRKQFSVRKGTIFEESRLPLRKWFAAAWLITSNRKGIPSTQLAREISVTQKTAWFMLHRLREIAGQKRNKHASKRKHLGRGPVGKQAVAGVRARTGEVRIDMVPSTDRRTLYDFLRSNVAQHSALYTDGHPAYVGLPGYDHEAVDHTIGEYVRGKAHTNGIESFWSLLKRGYTGVFHHLTWKHLDRYLNEFETRWNFRDMGSAARFDVLLESASGARLTYERLIANE